MRILISASLYTAVATRKYHVLSGKIPVNAMKAYGGAEV